MTQICIDCKKEFEDPAPPHGGYRKQRCAACQKIHTRQLQAAARERHRAAVAAKAKAEAKARKAADDPNAPAMQPPAPEPAPIVEETRKPQFRAPRKTAAIKTHNEHLSIEEVARLADAAGMSYGQYVALKLNRIGG